MQELDLSGNYLSRSIPSNLAIILPYIVSLDLSNNNLSGSIPSTIANWRFMIVLMLDKNHLTGQIPQELSKLTRLRKFSVANNKLSGPLPILSDATFPAESYANNLGLCGDPLDACIDEDLVGVFLSGFEVGLLGFPQVPYFIFQDRLTNQTSIMPQVEAKKMDWVLRYKIAVGIARGLSLLHNNNVLRVAHLKITSKCILLDDKFEPKISNFGNSIILMNTSGIPSSDCNFVVPHANPSPYKEDVYSFGMLLLELITGMRNNPLTDYRCGLDVCVIDEYLMGQGFDEEIYKTHKIAESCIRDEATTMLQVYQAMQAIEISRNEITVDVEDNEGDF
ncbi:protein kinase-like domain-containing protein [Artemisia annua]|uniref:Protein kinase-like domain-containing protein n=1 Tax=Artemisia annua TaxID=35608 RepID=A0A2U1NR84_ARTAN|nr:protein kinase-like domain-containing protein [Artemisia annua]